MSSKRKSHGLAAVIVAILAIFVLVASLYIVNRTEVSEETRFTGVSQMLVDNLNNAVEIFNQGSATVDQAYEIGFGDSGYGDLLTEINLLGADISKGYESFSSFVIEENSEAGEGLSGISYTVDKLAEPPNVDTEKKIRSYLEALSPRVESVNALTTELHDAIEKIELER